MFGWRSSEPEERRAAREWWKTSGNAEAVCDGGCHQRLHPDEGFLVDGRLVTLMGTKMNMGLELMCSSCFERLRHDPRDPGGRGDNYARIG